MDGFSGFLERFEKMHRALDDLSAIGDATAAKGAARLSAQLAAIEPSVTFIGQVKAGKTSLINAMTGWPDLLPADVNPWTSVVTSLHLRPASSTGAAGANFRFFDQEEWGRLVEKGGRLGELASRAGAEEELEKVRRQVERMREKSKGRLGRRFEMLLGQEHRYGAFDEALVERYVCLGDDFEDDSAARFDAAGRFADITKAADLLIDHAQVPLAMCLRDTPGVNDTFLMREQITIGAIRDSRLCVLVLSAHQALSTVDMALIRLIANVKARDVIIFVNRVDELSDPANQIEEIRSSIHATLKAQNGPENVPILFGSAIWGSHALKGDISALPEESLKSLRKFAGPDTPIDAEGQAGLEAVWTLSGIPALYRAIGERVEEGIGREALDRVARSVGNLARGLKAADSSLGRAAEQGRALQCDIPQLRIALDGIERRAAAALDVAFETQRAGFGTRLDRAHQSFLDRATAALIEHLEKHGDAKVWSYEPTGLRMLLRTACQVFGKRVHGDAKKVFAESAMEVAKTYREAFGLDRDVEIDAPIPPRVSPPVAIAQTIALDIKGAWWRRWWQRRRGFSNFAADFQKMIREETAPMVDDLRRDYADRMRDDLMRALHGFLAEQQEIVIALAEKSNATTQDLDTALGLDERNARLAAIESAVKTMKQEAA